MSRTKASFSHLQRSDFEGRLPRKLRFYLFSLQTLKEVLHESFVFTSSTFRFLRNISHESFAFTSSAFRLSGKSRTKAPFSHLQLEDSEGRLTRELRFHIFSLQTLREVLHESFDFKSSGFEGCLARKLRFHIFSFQTLRDVSHESFVFTSSTFRF